MQTPPGVTSYCDTNVCNTHKSTRTARTTTTDNTKPPRQSKAASIAITRHYAESGTIENCLIPLICVAASSL